jgi:hypothetical protein
MIVMGGLKENCSWLGQQTSKAGQTGLSSLKSLPEYCLAIRVQDIHVLKKNLWRPQHPKKGTRAHRNFFGQHLFLT